LNINEIQQESSYCRNGKQWTQVKWTSAGRTTFIQPSTIRLDWTSCWHTVLTSKFKLSKTFSTKLTLCHKQKQMDTFGPKTCYPEDIPADNCRALTSNGLRSFFSHIFLLVNSRNINKTLTGRAMAQAVSSRLLTAEASGQSMWYLWWTKWHWDRCFSKFFGFPWQYHSTVELHTHISSGGWKIGPLVAAVQRQSHPIDINIASNDRSVSCSS
jgi:hypothetical protein